MEKFAQAQSWLDIIEKMPYPRTWEEIAQAIEENGNISLDEFKKECESFRKLYLDMLDFSGKGGVSKKLNSMFNVVERILDIIGHNPEEADPEEEESLFDLLIDENEKDVVAECNLTTKHAETVAGVDYIDPQEFSFYEDPTKELAKQQALIAKRMLLVSPEEREILQNWYDELDQYREFYKQENIEKGLPQKPKQKITPQWSGAYTDWKGWGKGNTPAGGWEGREQWKPEGITEISPIKDPEPRTEGGKLKWYEEQKNLPKEVVKIPEKKKTFRKSSIEDRIKEEDVPKDELLKGIEIESEHDNTITDIFNELDNRDPSETELLDAQKDIALDHETEAEKYTEEPNYYEDYLIPMEEKMKKDISLASFKNIDELLKYARNNK